MAEFTTNRTNISIASITGTGAKLKEIVKHILATANGLVIHATNSDDETTYSVDLSWEGYTDWLIRIYNSNNTVYFSYMYLNTEGVYEEESYGSASLLSYNTAVVDVHQYDYDMLLVAAGNGSNLVDFMCLKVIDQFTGAARGVAGVGSSYDTYYGINYLYVTEGGIMKQITYEKNVVGLTPNGITAATPIVFYTTNSDIPMSGFVAEGTLLYYIYTGTEMKYFEDGLTNFTLGGHSFISLTRSICVKIS